MASQAISQAQHPVVDHFNAARKVRSITDYTLTLGLRLDRRPVFTSSLSVRKGHGFDDSLSLPVVAIRALLLVIEHSTSATIMGLLDELKAAQKELKAHVEQVRATKQ